MRILRRKIKVKNIEKAAKRILKAIKKKEKIVLYGDADLDGISSTVILKESIQSLGGNIVSVFFPDRENDGYGITERALEQLKDFSPALFIAMDLGVGNYNEAKIAKKMGFDLIIVDHHQMLDPVPKVSVLVDPKQKGDKFPFKGLAAVGVVFKLTEELLSKNFSESLRNSFLELVALATMADMMPVEEDNKIFIDEGLASIRNSFRPGIKSFMEIFKTNSLSGTEIQKMISALNISENINGLNETYKLLTSGSIEDAKPTAQSLLDKAQRKQMRVREIVQEVENRIKNKLGEPLIFEGDSFWPLVLAGSVASSLSQKYERPVFIFKKGDSESYGSVRVPKNINSVDAMKTCADFLITYGGHPVASGFRIKNQDLDRFKAKLTDYFNKLKK